MAATFAKGDQVKVNAPGLARHGSTGTVCYVRSDGDYEVEFPGSGFFDDLLGPAILRGDQLTPATR